MALTGGSGFIGRHFADGLRRHGYRIRHLARRRPPDGDPQDEWLPFDLGAADDAGSSLSGCAALIHVAAHIPARHDDPEEASHCLRINALGTLHLADAAARAGVGRIIQTCGANAYAPSMEPPDEQAALFPPSRGYYLGSKILQEIYALERCKGSGVMLQTMRIASPYGPGQQAGAIAAMARAAMRGGPIQVSGQGLFGADFVHVDDIVQALLLLLEDGQQGAFNVGSGMRTTIAALSGRISALTGARVVHEPIDGREEDSGFSALNIDRLRALGYRPMALDSGLRSLFVQSALC
ncbi:NAD(P)-dependent oxidoreductase [Sphingobium sp. Sx8-8]|uniref:NAD-dependent epimerase/dehydratase family protein n=1 Tax=Sphingobium sp. Sx8-8 TaxID=2933617 RepID=UPI001F596984|nr:NAD(P)-dependent oxidoreductase [Sphingobium sp. Sx8-8]